MSEAVKYEVRPATMEDAIFIGQNIRAVDRDEIFAASGLGPLYATTSSVKLSEVCKVGTADGVPVCIFGVRRLSLLSMYGMVWMLATDDLDKHAIRFTRECGPGLMKMLSGFNRVENWCDKRNKVTLRWLKWLGFTIDEPKPVGRKGELFHHFYMECDTCVS